MVFPPRIQNRLASLSDFLGAFDVSKPETYRNQLKTITHLFTTWGSMQHVDEILASAPRLEAIFYVAGDHRAFFTDTLRDSGVRLFSAVELNSKAVAEYTFAWVILALKESLPSAEHYRKAGQFPRGARCAGPGAYRTTVGLAGLGHIGRQTIALLKQTDLRLIAFDPHVDADVFRTFGVEPVDDLVDLFRQSRVVSLHLPLNDKTRAIIKRNCVEALPQGGSLINTARGALIDQPALLDVLQNRPDLRAYLDVTDPEPLPDNHPFFHMPNVFLSNHVAGSVNSECERLADVMIEDFVRITQGIPPLYEKFSG